jgi:hypothetical protein
VAQKINTPSRLPPKRSKAASARIAGQKKVIQLFGTINFEPSFDSGRERAKR